MKTVSVGSMEEGLLGEMVRTIGNLTDYPTVDEE